MFDGEFGWRCLACGLAMAPFRGRVKYWAVLVVGAVIGMGFGVFVALAMAEALLPGTFPEFDMSGSDGPVGVIVFAAFAVVGLSCAIWGLVMLRRPTPVRMEGEGPTEAPPS